MTNMYAPGESLRISAEQLSLLPNYVRKWIEYTLHKRDFKWVVEDEDDGVETWVHFGYEPRYGSFQKTPTNPLKLTTNGHGCVLKYKVSGVPHESQVRWIEIPVNIDDHYTFVGR